MKNSQLHGYSEMTGYICDRREHGTSFASTATKDNTRDLGTNVLFIAGFEPGLVSGRLHQRGALLFSLGLLRVLPPSSVTPKSTKAPCIQTVAGGGFEPPAVGL